MSKEVQTNILREGGQIQMLIKKNRRWRIQKLSKRQRIDFHFWPKQTDELVPPKNVEIVQRVPGTNRNNVLLIKTYRRG